MLYAILPIVGGILVVVAPFVIFSFFLLHPRYDKKRPDFFLDKLDDVSYEFVDSAGFAGGNLSLNINKAGSYKAIIYNAKSKPFKVYNVSCADTSKACLVKLPKKAKGFAVVERTGKRRVSFDIEIWKILVLPLAYALCVFLGAFLIGYGLCWFEVIVFGRNIRFNGIYPLTADIYMLLTFAAVAYAIGVLSFALHYMHLRRKEAK